MTSVILGTHASQLPWGMAPYLTHFKLFSLNGKEISGKLFSDWPKKTQINVPKQDFLQEGPGQTQSHFKPRIGQVDHNTDHSAGFRKLGFHTQGANSLPLETILGRSALPRGRLWDLEMSLLTIWPWGNSVVIVTLRSLLPWICSCMHRPLTPCVQETYRSGAAVPFDGTPVPGLGSPRMRGLLGLPSSENLTP